MPKISNIAVALCAVGAMDIDARAERTLVHQPITYVTARPRVVYFSEPVGEQPRGDERIEALHNAGAGRQYPPLLTGVELAVGGGVAGYTDDDVRDTTGGAAGAWTVRLALRTHRYLGVELGYAGSATSIDSQLDGRSTALVSTGIEGAGRFTFAPAARVAPYAFLGVGYQRFDMPYQSLALSDSGLQDSDAGIVFPVGAGVAYRVGRAIVDLRGTFRPSTSSELLMTTDDSAPMHSWAAAASLGYRL
jgi:hypothetical protein